MNPLMHKKRESVATSRFGLMMIAGLVLPLWTLQVAVASTMASKKDHYFVCPDGKVHNKSKYRNEIAIYGGDLTSNPLLAAVAQGRALDGTIVHRRTKRKINIRVLRLSEKAVNLDQDKKRRFTEKLMMEALSNLGGYAETSIRLGSNRSGSEAWFDINLQSNEGKRSSVRTYFYHRRNSDIFTDNSGNKWEMIPAYNDLNSSGILCDQGSTTMRARQVYTFTLGSIDSFGNRVNVQSRPFIMIIEAYIKPDFFTKSSTNIVDF